MKTMFVGQNKITLQTVDSTNNYAAKLLKMSFVPDGTVIMAQNQTNGRGQRDNEWKSEPGQNLLCSFVVHPKSIPAHSSFLISMVAALAVTDIIRQAIKSKEVAIKWPNDILANNKKIAGILIENSLVKGMVKSVVIGIGINTNQTELEYSHATSICNETNRLTDCDLLLRELSSNLEKWYLMLINGDSEKIIQEYNQQLWKRQEETKIKYNGMITSGTIQEVSSDGRITFSSNSQLISADFSELKLFYEK